MILAIFDIDGTLLDTSDVDRRCYLRALDLEFGISSISENWNDYRYPSDSGILLQVHQDRFGRPPNADETRAFIHRYLGQLEEAFGKKSDEFKETAGAGELVSRLSRSAVHAAGLATGSWRVTAAFKLKAGGLACRDLPLATSDRIPAREDIVRDCIEQTRERYDGRDFSRIVSVGDGPWDVITARKLGLPFIGVGDARLLGRFGARDVVRDFTDMDGFFHLLESAAVPAEAV